jgi:hypothetical protein
MWDDFLIAHTIPNFADRKTEVLQKILSLGTHSVVSDGQQISNTDWYLQGRTDRPYLNPILEDVDSALKKLHSKAYSALPSGSVQFKIDQYWFQQYSEGDFHSWHAHSVSYAAVIFVELGAGAETQFLLNGETKTVPVSEGQILIFPAMIPHRSPPNLSGSRKTSIALNISIC